MKSSLKSLIILVVLVLLVAISAFGLSNGMFENSNTSNDISNSVANSNNNSIKDNSSIVENTSVTANGLVWYDTLNAAQTAAKQSNKPIFLFVESSSCAYCAQMNTETFANPKVVSKLSADYICVAIDGDQSTSLVSKYGVRAYPTIIFLDFNGEKTSELVGFRSAEDLLSDLN